jgi:hypothetical protein
VNCSSTIQCRYQRSSCGPRERKGACQAPEKLDPNDLENCTPRCRGMKKSRQPASRGQLPRREVTQTPDEVAVMLQLKSLGWGVRRIANELGCSQPHDGARNLSEGGWVPYRGGRGGRAGWPGLRKGWRSASAESLPFSHPREPPARVFDGLRTLVSTVC